MRLFTLILFTLVSYNAIAIEPPPVPPIEQINDVMVTWDDPTLREDGANLSNAEIRSYLIAYGLKDDPGVASPIDVGKVNSHRINNLAAGEHVFFIAAVDTDGHQSVWSDSSTVIIVEISRPGAPTNVSTGVSNEVASTINAVKTCMTSNRCLTTVNIKWGKAGKS